MLREIKTTRVHYLVDENGLKQGEYKEYHDNGKLRFHSFYKNNKRHGERKVYYNNGQLCEHSFYLNGKLHGEYHSYDNHGMLVYATFCYHNTDLKVNPSILTQKDKAYILLSGRLPPRD